MKNQEVKKSMETKENESGRSMVEMLGVLAIMGVLAIGGIAGYRWAMDKYNANEILNEVRKRAVTASQQRILGQSIDLSEYGDKIQEYALISADNHDGNTGFFTLTIKDIPQGICNHVIAEYLPFSVWTSIQDQDIDELDNCPGEKNDILFAFVNTLDSGATPSASEPTIPAGKECTDSCTPSVPCVNGYCQCPDNQIWNPSDASDGGECVEVTGNCAKNADCEKVESCQNGKCYCAISSSTYSSTDSCTNPDKGECISLDEGNPAGTFLRSGSGMTWWSARNWCLAHDMKLVSPSDLGCSRSGCTDGEKLPEALRVSEYSDWTDDSYNSCRAFSVYLNSGYINHINRNDYGTFSLCVRR